MNIKKYQKRSRRTRPVHKNPNWDTFQEDISHAIFGIAGEAGEIVDPVKRTLFYGSDLDVDNIAEEIGDLMYYLAWLSDLIDYPLDKILNSNIRKLKRRYPDGFTTMHANLRLDKIDQANEDTGRTAEDYLRDYPNLDYGPKLNKTDRSELDKKIDDLTINKIDDSDMAMNLVGLLCI